MRVFDIGARDEPEVVSDRIATVPNLLTLLRLLALPIVYLDITNGRFARGLWVTGIIASTDWLDGYIERRFDQVSRLVKLIDPVVDRLLVAVLAVAMIVADIVPLWTVLIVLGRDVVLMIAVAVLIARGVPPLPVTRVGKAATFGLLFALPGIVLGHAVGGEAGDAVRATFWVIFAISVVLYYAAAGQYLLEGRRQLARQELADVPG